MSLLSAHAIALSASTRGRWPCRHSPGVFRDGVGLGSVIAVVCSWQRNRSVLWAVLAGILSWFYVIYFAITRRPDETRYG